MAKIYQITVSSSLNYNFLLNAMQGYVSTFGREILVQVGPKRYLLPKEAERMLAIRLHPLSLNEFFIRQTGVAAIQISEQRALELIQTSRADYWTTANFNDLGYSDALLDVGADKAHRAFPHAVKGLAGIRIAHVDTGISEHPCFGFLGNGGTETWVRFADGKNYLEPKDSPRDPWPVGNPYSGWPGHGTRTSSVLAGLDPGPSGMPDRRRFTGVAPQAPVIPYRISNYVFIDALGNDTDLDRALRHARESADAHVVSLSMGDPGNPREAVAREVDALYDNGIIFVAAAGNVIPWVVYPAAFSRVICVGGSTVFSHQPWGGGSAGPEVDISAPGDRVARADWQGQGALSVPVYGEGDGTSYATALTAGAAALWLSRYGVQNLRQRYEQGWQLVEAFRRQLAVTCRRGGSEWNTKRNGPGILDIHALLAPDLQDLPAPETLVRQPEAIREAFAKAQP